uniref:Putative ovule protein n=1 Tax=Solanum chacoense TaxID=4108 RepID=A0A0V0I3K1_SOLCH
MHIYFSCQSGGISQKGVRSKVQSAKKINKQGCEKELIQKYQTSIFLSLLFTDVTPTLIMIQSESMWA